MNRRSFRRLAVYCASSDATVPKFGALAEAVGRGLAERGIGVVYGGGRVGLMGRVADAALAAGGEVIGVIPRRLMDLELGHTGCTRLEVVDTMHERKTRMAELSDGFLALPGGWGTWEEMFEAVTWTQLGYHQKPAAIVDAHGYYDPIRTLLHNALDEGFVRPIFADLLVYTTSLEEALDRMATVDLPDLHKWIGAGGT